MCCLKICEATVRPEGEPIPKMRFRLPPTPAPVPVVEAPATPSETLPRIKFGSSSTSNVPQIALPRRKWSSVVELFEKKQLNLIGLLIYSRRRTCASRATPFQHSRRSSTEEAKGQDQGSRTEGSYSASFWNDRPRCRFLQKYPQENPQRQEVTLVPSTRRSCQSWRPRLLQCHSESDGSRNYGSQAYSWIVSRSLWFPRRLQTHHLER